MANLQEGGSGENIWSRRNLLSIAGWLAILGALQAGAVAMVALLFPRVLFEPPTAFKAGQPTDFTVGEVSERFMREQRVWIVREDTGGGSDQKTNSSVPATDRAFARTERTSKVRPLVRWSGSRSSGRTTGRSSSTKRWCFAKSLASGARPAPT